MLEHTFHTPLPATLEVSHAVLESLLTKHKLDLSICVLHLSGSDFRCGLNRCWRQDSHQFPRHGSVDGGSTKLDTGSRSTVHLGLVTCVAH